MCADYKDRFSKAEKEQQDKSAFACESCNTEYNQKKAAEKDDVCCDQPLKKIKK